MIVQCDQCSAKFRLDDAKVKEEGIKVRCSKCKHIFVVRKETPAEEADFDSFLSGLASPSPEPSAIPGETAFQDTGHPAQEEAPSETGLSAPEGPETEESPEREGFDLGDFSFNEGPSGALPAPPAGAEGDGGLDFGELDLERGDAAEVSGKGAPSFDEAAFSFSEEPPPPVPEIEIDIEGFEEPPKREEDFSFEPVAPGPEAAQSPPAPEGKGEEPAPFDFGDFEFGEAPSAEKPEKEEALPPETGDWDFGKPEAPAGKEDDWEFDKPEAPSSEPKDWGFEAPGSPSREQIDVQPVPGISAPEEELPPLSITSRRKGTSILPIAVTAVSVLLVIALAAGGYYFFKEGPSAFDKVGLGFAARWFGLEAKEEGKIGVRNTAGAFLNNTEAGEIFVVNGEAVNNFAKPRASIQVKATLYGPKGEVLQQKTAYCGNALSREQLATLPVAKLEAAMANQFGDSLSNLAVQPGKGIPFVVAFTGVPKGAAEFGVEVMGSTVASQ